MKTIGKVIITIIGSIIITSGIYIISIWPQGVRQVSNLENIDGITYPIRQETTHITEQIAHADINIDQPVMGKNLVLTITFTPRILDQLSVGVRENSFWLSYRPEVLYQKSTKTTANRLTKTVVIPLTDKIQAEDQSIDVMFFATPSLNQFSSTEKLSYSLIKDDQVDLAAVQTWLMNRADDTSYWELHDLKANIVNSPLTGFRDKVRIIDYVLSIVLRERAL